MHDRVKSLPPRLGYRLLLDLDRSWYEGVSFTCLFGAHSVHDDETMRISDIRGPW